MRTVRVFISSPSDAVRERDRLSRVARRLNLIYAEEAELEIIRWEDDFYGAHETFQTQIPEAKACDIVIGILKHRLGSPLPSTFPNMPDREPFLGEPYPSGTAYEILSSIASRLFEGSDKPDIYVFRDAEPPVVTLGSEDMERIGREWRRLEDFARRFFFTAEGDFRFAFQTFRSANQFEQQIEALLRKWIETNVYAEHRSIWPVAIKGSPFRALDVFDYAHRDVFFGRDRDTARIADLLAETAAEAAIEGSPKLPFLLLTGPSGAGKSSLLRAGLVPRLTASDVGDTEEWRLAVMTPSGGGKGPFATLAAALIGEPAGKANAAGPKTASQGDMPAALPELREGPFGTAESLMRLLAHGDASAALVVADALHRVEKERAAREKFDRPPTARLLLVVDQLDEIFASEIAEAERAAFAGLLSELARTGGVWIVASLRAGLYENLLSDPGFLALRNAGATYELGPPGSTELGDIVRKPAEAADIVYEKDPFTGYTLDDVLLADFDRPDMLPLLQFTLEALFKNRQTADGVITLTHAAYRQMNGIAGAVQTAADAAMATVGEAERQKLPKLLRRLVTTGHAGDGDVAPLVLNDVPASKLAADPDMLRLAEALTESRILVAGGSSSESRTYRLAHQRLLTLWEAAETAIRENATFFRVSEELEQAHRRWKRNGGRSAQLIRDPVLLTEATRLARAHPDEIPRSSLDFLRRSRLRARLGTILLGTSAAVFALLFAGTIWFYQRASVAEALALEQKQKAEGNFRLAQETLQGVIADIANGLKDVEGMSVASRRAILDRVGKTIEVLQYGGEDARALDDTRVQMWNAFGETYAAGGDAERALSAYREMIAINRRMLERADGPYRQEIERGIGVALERIGDLLAGQGRRQDALAAYQEAHDIRNRLLAADPDNVTLKRDLSVSIDRIGQSRQALGDVEGAIAAFEQGVATSRAQLAEYPGDRQAKRDLSISLEHIADLELGRGDPVRAAALTDELLAIRRALLQDDPNNTLAMTDIIVALLKKAELARAGGDLATAEATFAETLDRARALGRTDPGKIAWQRQIAVTLNSLADIALARGDREKARAGYAESLAIVRRAAATAAGDVDLESDIAYTLNRIGDVDKSAGKAAEAAAAYEESLAIVRKLSDRDPARPQARRNVAFTLSRLADAQAAMGRTAEARSAYQEAMRISEALAEADPSNPTWTFDLLLSVTRIADMDLSENRAKEARAGYQRAVGILKPLAESRPERADWARDLAVNLNKLGDAALRTGDTDAGAAAYAESLSIAEDLLGRDPANPMLKRDLAYCLGRVGAVERLKGDTASALARYRRGIAIVRELAAASPDNVMAQTDLVLSLITIAELQSGDERLTNLTEAEALADRLEQAGLLTGPQTALPGMVRSAIEKAKAQ